MKISTIILYAAFFILLLWESGEYGGTYTFAVFVAVEFLALVMLASIAEEETIFKGKLKWLEKRIKW